MTAWGSCSITTIKHSELLILIQLNLKIGRLCLAKGFQRFCLAKITVISEVIFQNWLVS